MRMANAMSMADIAARGFGGSAPVGFTDEDYARLILNYNYDNYNYEGIPVKVATATAITRPADTTAYAAGDLVANSTTAGSVVAGVISAARAVDAVTSMLRCRLRKSGATLTNAIFRIHFYNTAPTVTNGDNGVWLSTQSGYCGSMDVNIDKAFSSGSEGIGVPTNGSAIVFAPATGTADIYFLIEARAAYTPISAEQFTLETESL